MRVEIRLVAHMFGRLAAALIGTIAALTLIGCSQAQSVVAGSAHEPIVGLPCEGCEAVFEGLPEVLASTTRIAAEGEPGQPMQVEGTVCDSKGRTVSGVIVYAYHTNANGIYPTDQQTRGRSSVRHGKLRGWAKTDENGRYRFDTIRPAGYPNTDIPAHVHMHVIEVGRCTYYIDDILFDDDPRLTGEMRSKLTLGRGGNGIVTAKQDAAGIWLVTRDIVLGKNIPGYPESKN